MKTFKRVSRFTRSGLLKFHGVNLESSKYIFALNFIALSQDVINIAEDRINNGESLTIEVLGKHETTSGQPALVHFEEDDFVVEEVSYE